MILSILFGAYLKDSIKLDFTQVGFIFPCNYVGNFYLLYFSIFISRNINLKHVFTIANVWVYVFRFCKLKLLYKWKKNICMCICVQVCARSYACNIGIYGCLLSTPVYCSNIIAFFYMPPCALETNPPPLRSVHRVGHESGAVQPPALPDGVHAVPARRERQLPRFVDAVGRFHDTLA